MNALSAKLRSIIISISSELNTIYDKTVSTIFIGYQLIYLLALTEVFNREFYMKRIILFYNF